MISSFFPKFFHRQAKDKNNVKRNIQGKAACTFYCCKSLLTMLLCLFVENEIRNVTCRFFFLAIVEGRSQRADTQNAARKSFRPRSRFYKTSENNRRYYLLCVALRLLLFPRFSSAIGHLKKTMANANTCPLTNMSASLRRLASNFQTTQKVVVAVDFFNSCLNRPLHRRHPPPPPLAPY